jgi:hypothetical protein
MFRNWVRYKLKRVKVFFIKIERSHSLFKTDEPISEYEKTCASICRRLMNDKYSKFSIAPLSDKKYIVNENLGIFVVLQETNVEITNHVYHYEVKFNQRTAKRIHTLFDNKTEKIRLDYESQIKSQISNSLQGILKKVSK